MNNKEDYNILYLGEKGLTKLAWKHAKKGKWLKAMQILKKRHDLQYRRVPRAFIEDELM